GVGLVLVGQGQGGGRFTGAAGTEVFFFQQDDTQASFSKMIDEAGTGHPTANNNGIDSRGHLRSPSSEEYKVKSEELGACHSSFFTLHFSFPCLSHRSTSTRQS